MANAQKRVHVKTYVTDEAVYIATHVNIGGGNDWSEDYGRV